MPGFDTHEIVKRLKAAGFNEDQAEAVTEVVRDARNLDITTLATKADVAHAEKEMKGSVDAVRSELKASVDAVRSELKADMLALRADFAKLTAHVEKAIAEVKVDLLKWVIGLMIAQTGFILAMIRAMH